MRSDTLRAAAEAHLSPILCRVALIIAEVEGEEAARRFVLTCRLEDDDARRASPPTPAPDRPEHE